MRRSNWLAANPRTLTITSASASASASAMLGAVLFSFLVAGCAAPLENSPPDGGTGGHGGDAGVLPEGCATAAIFDKHSCTSICHKASAASAFGGFDMTTPGWEKKLVGAGPPDNAPATNVCKGKGLVYLNKTQPATGLFMDKLKNPPCGVQMPQLLAPLSATEMACVQKWANNIVAGGTGQ